MAVTGKTIKKHIGYEIILYKARDDMIFLASNSIEQDYNSCFTTYIWQLRQ